MKGRHLPAGKENVVPEGLVSLQDVLYVPKDILVVNLRERTSRFSLGRGRLNVIAPTSVNTSTSMMYSSALMNSYKENRK